MLFHSRSVPRTLRKQLPQDPQRIDVQGGVGVKFEVAEDGICDFVAGCAVQGDEHGGGEIGLHELLHCGVIVADKGLEVTGFGAEAEGDREFEKKADVEVAEVGLYRIQKQDDLLAPLVESFFVCAVFDCAVENFAHEHGH